RLSVHCYPFFPKSKRGRMLPRSFLLQNPPCSSLSAADLTAKRTSGRCSRTAAHGCLPEFKWKTFSYMIHGLRHLIKRNHTFHSTERKFRAGQRVRHSDGV